MTKRKFVEAFEESDSDFVDPEEGEAEPEEGDICSSICGRQETPITREDITVNLKINVMHFSNTNSQKLSRCMDLAESVEVAFKLYPIPNQTVTVREVFSHLKKIQQNEAFMLGTTYTQAQIEFLTLLPLKRLSYNLCMGILDPKTMSPISSPDENLDVNCKRVGKSSTYTDFSVSVFVVKHHEQEMDHG